MPPTADPGDVDLERLLDLTTPWCLRVAATLRIAHHIAAGRTRVEELAEAAGCDAEALDAVLGHLVSNGVFQEHSAGRFGLNPAAEELRDQERWLDLDRLGGRTAYAWNSLLVYVRTGRPAYQQLFGRPFWDDLAANPDLAADFDALMGPPGHGLPDYDIELTGGWDGVRCVVDVGGGTGAMLATLLRLHPHTRGVLLDLPGTVARSAEVLSGAGVAERVTVIGQSFFDPLPAGADVYLLKNVLNDWPDDETGAILRRCAEAARPNGQVVILGGVAPGEAPRRVEPETVLTGGRTNTVEQFRQLARQAGLELSASGTQRSGRFVVQCRPV